MAHWHYSLKTTDSDIDYRGRMIQCHQLGQSIIIVLDSWEILPGRFSGGQVGLDMHFLFF